MLPLSSLQLHFLKTSCRLSHQLHPFPHPLHSLFHSQLLGLEQRISDHSLRDSHSMTQNVYLLLLGFSSGVVHFIGVGNYILIPCIPPTYSLTYGKGQPSLLFPDCHSVHLRVSTSFHSLILVLVQNNISLTILDISFWQNNISLPGWSGLSFTYHRISALLSGLVILSEAASVAYPVQVLCRHEFF